MTKIALIDPGMFNWQTLSPNVGDHIISRASKRELRHIFDGKCKITSIPSHSVLDKSSYEIISKSDKIVVGGSNLFWFRLFPRASWPLRMIDTIKLRDVCFMGVGWGSYSIPVGPFGRYACKRIFAPQGMNSFRDNYSVDKARALGIPNPIFTGCHTSWVFGRGKTSFSLSRKGKCVFTLTDYAKDPVQDRLFIETLLKTYGRDNLYFWPQGGGDRVYAEGFNLIDPSRIIAGDLKAFETLLQNEDIDYVGTRLHGGIFALEHGKRSIIISIDNRAIEMGKDLGLVTLKRESISELGGLLAADTAYDLTIPSAQIEKWAQAMRR